MLKNKASLRKQPKMTILQNVELLFIEKSVSVDILRLQSSWSSNYVKINLVINPEFFVSASRRGEVTESMNNDFWRIQFLPDLLRFHRCNLKPENKLINKCYVITNTHRFSDWKQNIRNNYDDTNILDIILPTLLQHAHTYHNPG